MNLQIENVRQDIIDVINNSQLPIGVIYYLFKDISKEVANEYNKTLMLEQQQKQQEEEKQQDIKEENDGE